MSGDVWVAAAEGGCHWHLMGGVPALLPRTVPTMKSHPVKKARSASAEQAWCMSRGNSEAALGRGGPLSDGQVRGKRVDQTWPILCLGVTEMVDGGWLRKLWGS